MPSFSNETKCRVSALCLSFNLADDLGNAPSLPTDQANFPDEDVIDKWIDAPSPHAPLTADPYSHPMMTISIIPPTWEEPIQKMTLPSKGLLVKHGSGLGEGQTL